MADKNKKGKFIVIEGADGSGKATQAELLGDYFKQKGTGMEIFSFPRYDKGRSGRLMGELLRGDHGDFMAVSPYMSSLPYVINRVAARQELKAALDSGKVVICDRYLPSNLAHQSAKLKTEDEIIMGYPHSYELFYCLTTPSRTILGRARSSAEPVTLRSRQTPVLRHKNQP